MNSGNGAALAGDTRAEGEGFEPPRAITPAPPSGPPPSVETSLPKRLKNNTALYLPNVPQPRFYTGTRPGLCEFLYFATPEERIMRGSDKVSSCYLPSLRRASTMDASVIARAVLTRTKRSR